MSKENSHAYELLRQRDSLKRTRQVWIGGLVIWAVVVGWVIFGLVNALTDDLNVWLSWAVTWLVPVVILGAGTLMTMSRLRAVESGLHHTDG